MPLATIADLAQPQESKAPFIERAMQLSKWYADFKATDNENYSYTVDIFNEGSRSSGIHASEISNCQRKVAYSVMGLERQSPDEDDTDVNMRMRFAIGHAVHAMLQNDMHRMSARFKGDLMFEDEVKISPKLGGVSEEWNLYSHCDGIFSFLHNGSPYLRVGLEIKTASAAEYDKLLRPKDEHLDQTCFYQAALDLPLMWVFYYNKSNSNWTPAAPPYLYQFDQHRWENVLIPRFKAAHKHAQDQTLPDREEGMHCKWCPFAWECKPSSLRRGNYGPSTTVKNPGALKIVR